MNLTNNTISGWGHYPTLASTQYNPPNVSDLQTFVNQSESILARGNGRSYGDASLNEDWINMLGFDQILSFDPEKGLIECEAGVLLSKILIFTIPQGWFFNVSPGTQQITVGGAIAADVHGKNHQYAGCFSNWVQYIDLIIGDGTVQRCSKSENIELFWQTCGGMGWTGIIVRAGFVMQKIESTAIHQRTDTCTNFESVWRAFESQKNYSYQAGWLDAGFSTNGLVLSGFHAKNNEKYPLHFNPNKGISIPIWMPFSAINNISIGLYNRMYRQSKTDGESLVSIEKYFYPLDGIQGWNRLYGTDGMIQYQFLMPDKYAFDGIQKVLELMKNAKVKPFLAVLKRHGKRPDRAIHFPDQGWSLALDFRRNTYVLQLIKQLDELVFKNEGKIYLAKDSSSHGKLGGINPNIVGFNKFQSLQKRRIQHDWQ